ncbi:MAG: NADH:flavin oxidoreductase/NADH oxidase [Bacteroidales bacterium]|nr:NADH:flavin oxidoreductase/NADH oxidase [Bacteroidales bacterium]
MSKLFTPLTIKSVTFRNRLAIPPMCQYSAENGYANDYHLVHYGARSIGGAGLIIQEATAVSPEGRITPGDLGIWDDGHVDKLQAIASFIAAYGAVPGIQIAHAGRKAGCAKPWYGGKQLSPAEGGWQTVAPSGIPFAEGENAPAALDDAGIRKVVNDFRNAAGRAAAAGYKVLEIHAAHGYLIHQFLSPLANKRTDSFGGSFENRIRLLLEIVEAVNGNWPQHLPLFARLSTTDYIDGGWNADETVRLAVILKSKGIDLIDTSSGGMVPYAKIPFGPGYQAGFAEKIRKEAGIITGAVGFITEARQAEEILEKGQADLVLVGRQWLRDPHFALNAAKVLGDDIAWPEQYLRAKS